MSSLIITKIRSMNLDRKFGFTADGTFFHFSALVPKNMRRLPQVGDEVCAYIVEQGPKGPKFNSLFWGRQAADMIRQDAEMLAREANAAEIAARPADTVIVEAVGWKPIEWLDGDVAIFPVERVIGRAWKEGDIYSPGTDPYRVRKEAGEPQTHHLTRWEAKPVWVYGGEGYYRYHHPTQGMYVDRQVPVDVVRRRLAVSSSGSAGIYNTCRFPDGTELEAWEPLRWDPRCFGIEVSTERVYRRIDNTYTYESDDGRSTRQGGEVCTLNGAQLVATYIRKPEGYPEETEAVEQMKAESFNGSINALPIWEEIAVTPDEEGEYVSCEQERSGYPAKIDIWVVRYKADPAGEVKRVTRLGRHS
jgi:cold shock CspA family protein